MLLSAAAVVAAGVAFTGPTVSAAKSSPDFAPLPDAPKVKESQARLGAMLFFDTRLSGDTSLSCASCHDPAKGWGTGEPMSQGYTSVLYFRNAPGLFNVSNRNLFMWDGRLDGSDLGTLVRDMMTEAHTMNVDTRIAQERLKQIPEYAALFEQAFGGDPYGGKIYAAIGEYLKTIRTVNAPFDRFLRGDAKAIGQDAKRGMALFVGKAGCAQCHSGAMLSDGGLHATGVPDHPDLIGKSGAGAVHGDQARRAEKADRGVPAGHEGHGGPAGHVSSGDPDTSALRQIAMLRHFATMGVPNYMNLRSDVGRYVVTKDEADIGKFVTPSLWDVGHTAPYMHSGVFATLADVVDFYDAGGGTGPNKSKLLKPLGLTSQEKADLTAFLKSLTGDAPRVTEPKLPEYELRKVGKN